MGDKRNQLADRERKYSGNAVCRAKRGERGKVLGIGDEANGDGSICD